MQICYVANGINFPYRGGSGSGGSTHVYEIAKGLLKHGHTIYVLCSRPPRQTTEETFEGIVIHRIFSSGADLCQTLRRHKLVWAATKVPYYISKLFVEIVRLTRFLVSSRCDVVYERTSASTWMHSLLYFALRKPLILEVNDYYHDPLSLWIAKTVITPNKSALPFYVQHKTKQLQWGANIEKFRPDIDATDIRKHYDLQNKKIALMVCSGLPWHGLAELIDAAEIVSKKMPDVIFMIVGSINNLIDYKEKIRLSGLKNRFIFTGPVDYSLVPKFISLADVTLAPYNSLLNQYGERAHYASPLKVFEYMACGKPSILTEVANLNNVVENMKTGIVIPEDSAEALVDAITYLFDNKDVCDTLAENARKTVEQEFSWQNHVKRLSEVLTDCKFDSTHNM